MAAASEPKRRKTTHTVHDSSRMATAIALEAGVDSAGFPGGDSLAVVLSFMALRDVLGKKGAWRVSREFWRVLCSCGHAWPRSLDLSGLLAAPSSCPYAWQRVQVRSWQ